MDSEFRRLVEENEKHGVEYRDLDIQLDQCGQAINGFSKVDGLGVEIDFFDFGVGSYHDGLATEGAGIQHPGSIECFECGVHGALILEVS